MLALVVAGTLVLTGAKFWQDPNALPDGLNCGNGVCCAQCIETAGGLGPERTVGWEWKLRLAGHIAP